MAEPERVRELVALAVGAAGPIGGNDYDWKQRVEAAIPSIVSVLGETSRQSKAAERMLDSQMFGPAVVESITLEASTQRMILRLQGEENPIRSDHTQSAPGRRMKARLDKLQPGDRVLVWRFNEPMKGDPRKKVRVLTHIEKLANLDKDAAQSRPPALPPAERAAAPPTEDASTGVLGHDQTSVFDAQDPPLTPQQMVRVVQRCRSAGVENPAFPAPEDLDKVLLVISEETRA